MTVEPHDLRFTVLGPPVGKERPRRGRHGHFYTPTKTIDFEQDVAMAYLRAVRRRLDPPALHVGVHCYFRNGHHPDPDNVLKAVLDGLTGLAYPNDRQVSSEVHWALDAANPRTEVWLQ